MGSQPYTCAKGKQIKEYYHGSVAKYVWDEKQKLYIPNGEEMTVHFCWQCDPSCIPEICRFTDTDNIACQG